MGLLGSVSASALFTDVWGLCVKQATLHTQHPACEPSHLHSRCTDMRMERLSSLLFWPCVCFAVEE
jgi:hypothetical protein